MHLSKDFWNILVCGFAIIVLVVIGFYAWYYYTLYLHEQETEQVMTRIVAIQKELYRKHLAGEFGGASPYEVLYFYTEAIERRDYEIANTYFIKSSRTEALRALQDASPEEILAFTDALKQMLRNIKDTAFSGSAFAITSPVSVSFEAVESGVWKIQNIRYPFQ